MTDQESEHNKEVYAYFGLAYSSACVFETGLVNALLYLDHLTEVKRSYKGPETFDRMTYEADFDAYVAKQQAATLGSLIKRVQSLAEMDGNLKALIYKALNRRNFLAHRFFWDHALIFMKAEGRDQMIRELKADVALFDEADHAVSFFVEPCRVALGITQEMTRNWMTRYYDEQGLAGEIRSQS